MMSLMTKLEGRIYQHDLGQGFIKQLPCLVIVSEIFQKNERTGGKGDRRTRNFFYVFLIKLSFSFKIKKIFFSKMKVINAIIFCG